MLKEKIYDFFQSSWKKINITKAGYMWHQLTLETKHFHRVSQDRL